MATPAQKLLARAVRYVGYHEDPYGSNDGPFVRRCFSFTWLKFKQIPKGKAYWCIAYIQLVCAEAGFRLPWGTAGAFDLWERGKAAGWAIKKPKPGAIAIWNLGSGHGSFIRKVLPGGMVETIGGNEGDEVRIDTRPISQARGFLWHPALSKKATTVPKPKKPKKEKLTSASGKSVIVYSSRLRKILNQTGIGSFTRPANQERPK